MAGEIEQGKGGKDGGRERQGKGGKDGKGE